MAGWPLLCAAIHYSSWGLPTRCSHATGYCLRAIWPMRVHSSSKPVVSLNSTWRRRVDLSDRVEQMANIHCRVAPCCHDSHPNLDMKTFNLILENCGTYTMIYYHDWSSMWSFSHFLLDRQNKIRSFPPSLEVKCSDLFLDYCNFQHDTQICNIQLCCTLNPLGHALSNWLK